MSEMTVVHRAPVADLNPAGQRPGADSGDPQLCTLPIAPQATGSIGIWECQPGGWPVTDRPDTEVAYIISGIATITDDATGVAHQVTAGDLLVLPPGWSGRWDVTATVRKVYVIY